MSADGWLLVGIAVEVNAAGLLYGLLARWWKSPLAVAVFLLLLSLAVSVDVILLPRLFGLYPGQGIVELVVWSGIFLVQGFLLTVLAMYLTGRLPPRPRERRAH